MLKSQQEEILQAIELVLKTSVDLKSSRNTTPNWDSLTHMELIFTLEDKFSLEFSEEQLGELDTVEKILNFIQDGRS